MKRKIRIGYWNKSCKTKLYYPHDSHIILTAPAGSGKGTSIIVPALLEHEGSVICIDPKGENAAVCGPNLVKQGVRVVQLNPFNILPKALASLEAVGFNALDPLNAKSDSFGSDCDSLGEAICYHEGGGEDAGYFTDSARQLLSGGIMRIAKSAPPAQRNLLTLYEVISGSDFFQFARDAVNTGDLLLKGRLGRFTARKAEENKELSGILNTARTAMGFMGNKAMMQSLKGSNPPLRFSDMRNKRTVVFLILPTRYLATSSKWFRLVIAAAMADLLQEVRGPIGVLALLDEFAQLSTLKIMSDIMGIGRGYGLQLWPILQDLNQLKELYPQRWETFLANAGAQIFFAPRDLTTADYVSRKCGITKVEQTSNTVSQPIFGSKERGMDIGGSMGIGFETRPLYHPHEVSEIPADEMFVFGENIPGVIRAGRRPYWLMPECKGKFSPNPYHASEKRA